MLRLDSTVDVTAGFDQPETVRSQYLERQRFVRTIFTPIEICLIKAGRTRRQKSVNVQAGENRL